jgi:hypothetical protein
MNRQFEKGDTVHWSSSGGASTGKVIKVHTKDFSFKGVRHRAAANEPLYEVERARAGKLPYTRDRHCINKCSAFYPDH